MNYINLLHQAKELTNSDDPQILIQVAKTLDELTNRTEAPGGNSIGTFPEFLRTCLYQNFNSPTYHSSIQTLQPYPFQDDLAHIMPHSPLLVINSSRQMGMTSMYAFYALWFAKKYHGAKILIISNSYVSGDTYFDRIKLQFEMDQYSDITVDQKRFIQFMNGSEIKHATSTSKHISCGSSYDLIMIDDAAYISFANEGEIEMLMHTALSAQRSGCPSQVIMNSSPNTKAGLFYKYWTESAKLVTRVQLPAMSHPERDMAWYNNMVSTIGLHSFTKDYACTFMDLPK